MFRKLKDRISVVGEDIKNDPRFQNGLASVNKVASDTLAAINKSESGQSLQDQVRSPRKSCVLLYSDRLGSRKSVTVSGVAS